MVRVISEDLPAKLDPCVPFEGIAYRTNAEPDLAVREPLRSEKLMEGQGAHKALGAQRSEPAHPVHGQCQLTSPLDSGSCTQAVDPLASEYLIGRVRPTGGGTNGRPYEMSPLSRTLYEGPAKKGKLRSCQIQPASRTGSQQRKERSDHSVPAVFNSRAVSEKARGIRLPQRDSDHIAAWVRTAPRYTFELQDLRDTSQAGVVIDAVRSDQSRVQKVRKKLHHVSANIARRRIRKRLVDGVQKGLRLLDSGLEKPPDRHTDRVQPEVRFSVGAVEDGPVVHLLENHGTPGLWQTLHGHDRPVSPGFR